MKIKILLKNMRFNGGSPTSLLSYAILLKKMGNHILSVGEYVDGSILERYHSNNITTYNLDHFDLKKPIRNFYRLNKYIKIINKEKPEIILSITTTNILMNKLVNRLCKIPIIYIIPGGEIANSLNVQMIDKYLDREDNVVCFSEENKNELKKIGIKKTKTTIIPNRMFIDDFSNDLKVYQSVSTLKLLLISRIDEDKINSIYTCIDLVESLITKGIHCELTILGDGRLFSEVEKKSNNINKKFKKPVIKMEGYVENTKSYVINSHIVLGKGKSVLNALIYSRYGVVISEEDTMFIISPQNFRNMMSTNFTGRKFRHITNTKDDIINLSEKIKRWDISNDKFQELYDMVYSSYDIRSKQTKILSFFSEFKKNEESKESPSLLEIICEYTRLYNIIVKFKISNFLRR